MPDPRPPVMMLFNTAEVYLWGFSHQLGRVRRDLAELKAAGLIGNEVADLAKQGYSSNYGVAADESLVSLAAGPVRKLLGLCPEPQAMVFHHSYEASAVLPTSAPPAMQYFPAALLRELDVDHIPYFGSFSTGCTGLLSLIMTASGLCSFSKGGPIICVTADIRPAASKYDAAREKFLTSDGASGFLMGREPRGYRALGLSYYSTRRDLMPLVEVVKRTVQMARGLTDALGIDGTQREFVIHYPNIFPSAWPMVTNYLKLTPAPQELEGLAERAHCLSSDPVISLAGRHRGQAGRLHIVVNFGSGLHLGVGIFEETRDEPAA